MHSIEHEGHGQQVAVLETYYVPLVVRCRLVRIDVSQQTEREHHDAHVYPGQSGRDIDDCGLDFTLVFGLHEGASEGNGYVAGIVNDEDHGSCGNFIAHHGEEDECGSHEVVQQVLVELSPQPPTMLVNQYS